MNEIRVETREETLQLPLLEQGRAPNAAAPYFGPACNIFSAMLKPNLAPAALFAPGDVILNKYTVERRFNVACGGADLYLVTVQNQRFIAKLYQDKTNVTPETLAALRQLNAAHVAPIYEIAELNGGHVVIMPYYANGSLKGRLFSLKKLKTLIIPAVNRGLKALHDHGIIHKNLKPANLMLSDDEASVALTDFAVNVKHSDPGAETAAKSVLTPEYMAPEVWQNQFTPETDYYALGVIIFELYCGYAPYANMLATEAAQYAASHKIPLPPDMPHELQNLITALTCRNIAQNNDPHNVNRRWTFADVERWCADEAPPVPKLVWPAAQTEIASYKFKGGAYNDLNTLVRAWARNWADGKQEVFSGRAAAFFQSHQPSIATRCQTAANQALIQNGHADLVFWRLLYLLNPDMRIFYWQGYIYESLPAVGREMLEKLWQNDDGMFTWYKSILNEKLLTIYITLATPANTALKQAVTALENCYAQAGADYNNLRHTFFLMAYLLSGQKILNMGNKRFCTVGELALHLQHLLDNSQDAFQRFCRFMVDAKGRLDCQLSAWLIAHGKHAELEGWRKMVANRGI